MRIVFAAKAAAELRAIEAHIARDDTHAAARVSDDLLRACLTLVETPERGTLIGELRNAKLRRLVVSPYLIFYSVSTNAVWILRIVHGARSPHALLKGLGLP